jgi:hypothetical protein
LNLILDLRRVVCESVTLRGLDEGPVPRPGIGPGPAASKTAVRPTHSRGAIRTEQCPRQELNLVYDLRRIVCDSVTLQGLPYATLLRAGFAAFDQSHGIPHYFRSLGTLSEKKSYSSGYASDTSSLSNVRAHGLSFRSATEDTHVRRRN